MKNIKEKKKSLFLKIIRIILICTFTIAILVFGLYKLITYQWQDEPRNYPVTNQYITELGDTMVLDTINAADLLADEVREYAITLPAEIDNLSGVDKVEVTISLPYLETKVLPIKNISVFGAPVGMTADIGTKARTKETQRLAPGFRKPDELLFPF